MVSGEFVVYDISRAGINEVFSESVGSIWYKIKTSFLSIDDNGGKEKKTAHTSLILADNVDEAGQHIKEAMSGLMVDYVVESITDSKILDYFPYNN